MNAMRNFISGRRRRAAGGALVTVATLVALAALGALGAPCALAAAPDVPAATPEEPGPRLPRLAGRMRVSGAVEVEVLLDEKGAVRATNVLRSQPLLDDAACAAARRMAYEAATVEGEAQPSTRTVTITFPPPLAIAIADQQAARACESVAFALAIDPRPDSSGTFVATWSARAPRTFELFVTLLHPDGVEIDTSGSWDPQSFADDTDAGWPTWPTWHAAGQPLQRGGTRGRIAFRLPETAWWDDGRVALIALFNDPFSARTIARQYVWRIRKDKAGPILVRDPGAAACVAGPYVPP